MDEWLTKSASELGRAIGAGVVDPVTLTEAFLDRAATHDLGPRIYARLTPVRAMDEARAARIRAKNGTRHGPLDGVPISWKDLFDTAGVVTEAGSMLLQGRTPTVDAHVVQRATQAGLICLGKTHMSELAFSGLGINPAYGGMVDPQPGTPPNVHDPALVPGGSSSGAATSVAFGLAAAAIGSDTGGSVRGPAAYNDLVGFKPTHGQLSLTGVVPLASRFDTIGPLARSVEDCAALFMMLNDAPLSLDLRGATVSGRRFLVLDPYTIDAHPVPRDAFAAAVERLANAGAHIEHETLHGVDEAMALSPRLFAPEAYGIWSKIIEAAPEKMFSRILERFRTGAHISAPDYVAAWRRLKVLRQSWMDQTAAFDAVLLPTVATQPANMARAMDDPKYYVHENLMVLRNTRVANLMGACALTLPTGVPSAGIMMLCPPMADARLLRLGAAVEAVLA